VSGINPIDAQKELFGAPPCRPPGSHGRGALPGFNVTRSHAAFLLPPTRDAAIGREHVPSVVVTKTFVNHPRRWQRHRKRRPIGQRLPFAFSFTPGLSFS